MPGHDSMHHYTTPLSSNYVASAVAESLAVLLSPRESDTGSPIQGVTEVKLTQFHVVMSFSTCVCGAKHMQQSA